MSEFVLKPHVAVEISEAERDQMAARCVAEARKRLVGLAMTGDTLVIAFAEKGNLEVYDCQIRRYYEKYEDK